MDGSATQKIMIFSCRLLKKIFKSKVEARQVNLGLYMAFWTLFFICDSFGCKLGCLPNSTLCRHCRAAGLTRLLVVPVLVMACSDSNRRAQQLQIAARYSFKTISVIWITIHCTDLFWYLPLIPWLRDREKSKGPSRAKWWTLLWSITCSREIDTTTQNSQSIKPFWLSN